MNICPPASCKLLPVLMAALFLAGCASQPEVTAPPAMESTPEVVEEEETAAPTRPFPDDSFHDLLVAEFAVRRSRYDLALGKYLQQAHQTRDPGVTARATRLAQFLRADKATLDAAQLWVELEPDSIEAQYTTATTLAKYQRPLEAMKHMSTALELGGKTNFAAIAASSLEMPESIRDAVERNIDGLLVSYPDNTQLLTAKALLLQQRGEAETALQLIRQVLEIDNKDLHAVIVEARLLQQLDREPEALARLQQMVEVFPKNRRLRLQYARMLMSEDMSLAKEQFEALLAMTPEDPDLLLSLGLISKETRQLDDARDYFQRLLATGERTTESFYYLGQLAELRGELATAIEHYKNIQPGKDFLAAINRISYLYRQLDRLDDALFYLAELRQQHSDHAVQLYILEAELLLKAGQAEQGHQLLTEALFAHPQQASLLYSRSMLSEKLGQLELMEQDLRDILRQDSDNATALNALGYVLANRTERLDEAYELITQALAAKPNEPAIMDSLGWVEYRRGNLQSALKLLQQAYEAYPDHEVAAHLGEVLWQLGKTDEANNIWQEGLAGNPASPVLRETIQRLNPGLLYETNGNP